MSPKKSKKEKKAAKAAASASEVVIKDTNVIVSTEAKPEPQRTGVEAELIAAMEDEVVTPEAEVTQKEAGDGMTPKSSKSSRKKKTKESREKYSVRRIVVSLTSCTRNVRNGLVHKCSNKRRERSQSTQQGFRSCCFENDRLIHYI